MPGANGFAGPGLGLVGPVPVIHGPAGEAFDRADLVEGFVKDLALVHFAGADEQADVLPGKLLQFLRQRGQRFGDGLGGGGPFVAEEIAVLEPDDLAAAEEGQGLEGLAQSARALGPRRCW